MELNAKVTVEPNRFRVYIINKDGSDGAASGVFRNLADAYELAAKWSSFSEVESTVIKQWYCTEEEVLTRWTKFDFVPNVAK